MTPLCPVVVEPVTLSLTLGHSRSPDHSEGGTGLPLIRARGGPLGPTQGPQAPHHLKVVQDHAEVGAAGPEGTEDVLY